MICNRGALLLKEPIKDMCDRKHKHSVSGTSFGLSEAGYDITIKESIEFTPNKKVNIFGKKQDLIKRFSNNYIDDFFNFKTEYFNGRFLLASSFEYFQMPNDLIGEVKDKSTWARQGLSVFNTVIEPGWEGYLTLELVYHGQETLYIPSGSGIAQVIFYETTVPASYIGKYQNQESGPQQARFN
jgi:dCTP deaminase